MKKFYDILGLAETASLEEITKAFRKRIRVVHPDRFDQRTQPEEWEQANRMLQELNDAYARLKAFHQNGGRTHSGQNRASEANGSQSSQRAKREERKENREEKTQESSSKSSGSYDFFSTVIRGTKRFDVRKAPPEVRSFLKGLHKDNNVLKIYSVRTQLHFLVAIASIALFVYLSVLYYNGDVSSVDSGFVLLLILAIGCSAGYFLVKFLKFFLCPVRPYFYFTPVYFIHVDLSGMVEFCYLWEVRSINYNRENFNLPYFNIVLNSKLIVANLMPWFGLESFKKRFNELNSFRYGVDEKPQWLFDNDILNSQEIETRSRFNLLYMLTYGTVTFVLILVWSIVLPHGNDAISANTISQLENHATRETEASSNENVPNPTGNQAPVFDKPEMPHPENGDEFSYSMYRCIAPLRISVPAGNEFYFVKVVNANTNNPVKTIFIHPGQTIKTKVPLGNLQLKYATGQRWYGRKYLFGPNTVVWVADEILNFEVVGNRVSGYTVDLIKQQDGNLHTKQIDIGFF